MHDVAKLAGVSRQTVSRAVNDKGEIDPDTKARVLEAVRMLDYRPSRFARGLVRKGTVTAGPVIPDLMNPFFPEVAAGVLEAAEERGWQVVVWDTRTDGAKEREALGVLSHQADAVMGYFKNDDEVLARYLGGLPLVLLERGPQQTRFAAVGIAAAAGLEQGMPTWSGQVTGGSACWTVTGSPPGPDGRRSWPRCGGTGCRSTTAGSRCPTATASRAARRRWSNSSIPGPS